MKKSHRMNLVKASAITGLLIGGISTSAMANSLPASGGLYIANGAGLGTFYSFTYIAENTQVVQAAINSAGSMNNVFLDIGGVTTNFGQFMTNEAAAGISNATFVSYAQSNPYSIPSGITVDSVSQGSYNYSASSSSVTPPTPPTIPTSTTTSTGTSSSTSTSTSTTTSTSTSTSTSSGTSTSTTSSTSTATSTSTTTSVGAMSITAGTPPNGSTLATPTNVQANGSTMIWNPVMDATGYSLTITDMNGNTIESDVTSSSSNSASSFDLSQWVPAGSYEVTITATGSNTTYQDSPPSSPTIVNVSQSNLLAAPTNVQVNGTTVSWDPVTNANEYDVYLTDASSGNYYADEYVSTNDINLSDYAIPNGTYNVQIDAQDTNGIFGSSNYTQANQTVTITNGSTAIISAPTNVVVNGTVVSWTPVSNAANYEVGWTSTTNSNNWNWISADPQYFTQNQSGQLTFDLSSYSQLFPESIPTDNYTVYVESINAQNINSSQSNIPNVSLTELADPAGITINGSTLSWQSVPNASAYDVNFVDNNGTLYNMTVSGTSVNLSNNLPSSITPGTYDVTIAAKGTGYTPSEGAVAGRIVLGS